MGLIDTLWARSLLICEIAFLTSFTAPSVSFSRTNSTVITD